MDKRIVFEVDGRVIVLIPGAPEYTLEEIGQKDVPDGVPFWIVDGESIPADRTFRNAWELDAAALGKPHGVGDTAAFEKLFKDREATEEQEPQND